MARTGKRKTVDRKLASSYAKPASALLADAKLLHDEGGSLYSVEQLAINASIRASDAICVALRGEHAQGADHREAVRILDTVAPDLSSKLDVVLKRKVIDQYDVKSPSSKDVIRVLRCAEALVARALEVTGLG
jgi:hypothetical protein